MQVTGIDEVATKVGHHHSSLPPTQMDSASRGVIALLSPHHPYNNYISLVHAARSLPPLDNKHYVGEIKVDVGFADIEKQLPGTKLIRELI